jgi:putative methionine-R-sulfoxide reductase with GAF domain
MESYSILDHNSQAGPKPALPSLVTSNLAAGDDSAAAKSDPASVEAKEKAVVRETLRFPGEDGGKSLSQMAQRDLDATLQLLAERAQYITGASGAAIALRQGDSMVCCASTGPSAPELGAHLQIDSGLSAESVRTRKILICEDAENDPRVNRESCKAFGIASVVVMPLVRGDDVYGVFELLSGRPRAFEERDFVALNRLSEMIQTAVEHSEGARHTEEKLGEPAIESAASKQGNSPEISLEPADEILDVDPVSSGPETDAVKISTLEGAGGLTGVMVAASPDLHEDVLAVSEASLSSTDKNLETIAEGGDSSGSTKIEFGNLRRCETCGFPVSQGRRLCLDCEASAPGEVATVSDDPAFLASLNEPNQSWVKSHGYLIATALVAVATIALLIWRL